MDIYEFIYKNIFFFLIFSLYKTKQKQIVSFKTIEVLLRYLQKYFYINTRLKPRYTYWMLS